MSSYAPNPLDTFPHSFPIHGEVANLLWIFSRETGVMDFGKTCNGEVANLLQTCYGETGVVDFGLYSAQTASAG